MNAEVAEKLIAFFQQPGPYAAFVAGGGDWDWRRNTDPAEVADTAVFLASDLGRGVTGNIVYVDSGFQIVGLGLGA